MLTKTSEHQVLTLKSLACRAWSDDAQKQSVESVADAATPLLLRHGPALIQDMAVSVAESVAAAYLAEAGLARDGALSRPLACHLGFQLIIQPKLDVSNTCLTFSYQPFVTKCMHTKPMCISHSSKQCLWKGGMPDESCDGLPPYKRRESSLHVLCPVQGIWAEGRRPLWAQGVGRCCCIAA
jgi:hypothetical protein